MKTVTNLLYKEISSQQLVLLPSNNVDRFSETKRGSLFGKPLFVSYMMNIWKFIK